MANLQGQNSPAMEKLIQQHPLQRLQSPSRSLSAILHVIGLASFANSFKFLADNPNHINTAYGWHFQYLTIIGLALSTSTFAFGFLSDLTLSPQLFLVKNILSICSAPMAVLISMLYWGIRAIDSTLVIPKELELPLAADVGFHAAPSVLLLIDLLFFSPPWTITVMPALGLSTAIAFAYWYWLELCFQHNGFYPYPLLDLLDTTQRVMLFSGCAVAMASSTVVLRWLYGRINGIERVKQGGRSGRVKG